MSRRGENIYRRKDGLWEARYVKEIDINGKKKYGSVYARTYREVKEKRQAVTEHILLYQRPLVASSSWTVERLAEEWLQINRSRLKPSTYERYTSFCKNHIFPQIGSMRLVYLSTVILHDFAVRRMETGLSPRTVNSILVFLHSVMKYGNRQYHLPIIDIVYLATYKKEMRVLTVEEEKQLVSFLLQDIDNYKLGILIALYTGVRIGELCALRWQNLKDDCLNICGTMQRKKKDKNSGTELIVVPPKTTSSVRCIPLPEFLPELLSRFQTNPQGYILGTETKPIIEPRVMQYNFTKYLKQLGIEKATFHTLRHTFATRCVEKGFDIKTLSEILGHSSVTVTLALYVHSSLDFKRENMKKLTLAL